MSTVLQIIIVLHLLCWAVALGLWVAAMRTREPNKGMAHAAGGALVLGMAAMVVAMGAGYGGSHMFYGLKLLFAVIATACAFVAINRQRETPAAVWYGIPLAIIANVVVAVFGIGK